MKNSFSLTSSLTWLPTKKKPTPSCDTKRVVKDTHGGGSKVFKRACGRCPESLPRACGG